MSSSSGLEHSYVVTSDGEVGDVVSMSMTECDDRVLDMDVAVG